MQTKIASAAGAIAAIARFECLLGMSSAEFTERFREGEFGQAAWARAWLSLLQ